MHDICWRDYKSKTAWRESVSANHTAVDIAIPEFRELSMQYNLQDICNMDETGLFYKYIHRVLSPSAGCTCHKWLVIGMIILLWRFYCAYFDLITPIFELVRPFQKFCE